MPRRSVRRIVLKVGTRVLTEPTGRLDGRAVRRVVQQCAELHRLGCQVLLVTSGAIGAGVEALEMKTRPVTLPELQMAAAVGQAKLMHTYARLFARSSIDVGQLLLTHDDLRNRTRFLNIRNAVESLLKRRIVPIVNENDVVSVDEIKIGDNDTLSALLATLCGADLLVLLTTVDGLLDGQGRRVPHVAAVTPEVLGLASGKASGLSTGGMASKLRAARLANKSGIRVVIANGRTPDVVARILDGGDVGTVVGGMDTSENASRAVRLRARKQWLGLFHRPSGRLTVDNGAAEALQTRGRSLLAVGVATVGGEFAAGSVVRVMRGDGQVVGYGLVNYGSSDLRRIAGLKTAAIAGALGGKFYDEVIHRNNFVLGASDE
jgi:glutamate 5-kinase